MTARCTSGGGQLLDPGPDYPFALQRLSQNEEGRLVYRMKRPRGGSLFLLLTPDDLIARIATLVPSPRVHGLRFHGVFAPNSFVRTHEVVARVNLHLYKFVRHVMG